MNTTHVNAVSNVCGYALSLAMLNTVAAPPVGWLPIFASDMKALFARADITLDDILETTFTILLQKLPGADKTEFMLARHLPDKLIAERNARANGSTTRSLSSAEILAVRTQLLDNGWNAVPSSPKDKGCYVIGWPVIESNEFYIGKWAWSFPAHTNTAAVCNRNYFGVDVDVLSDAELAHRVQALAVQHLSCTPLIRVGRWPKRLLVYRKQPGTIRSVSFKAASGNGDGIEILSDGKNFVMHGVHAETGQPYHWIGECNPLEDTPLSAPLVGPEQIDAFLAAVDQIMPLATRRAGNGGDAARHVNADGLIDDGRESFLRDCIWQAANEIDSGDAALTAQAIASRGWELFEERAWLGDNKYNYTKHALSKARLLLRRVNNGRVKLNAVPEAPPTYAAEGRDNSVRTKLRAALLGFSLTIYTNPEEEEAAS